MEVSKHLVFAGHGADGAGDLLAELRKKGPGRKEVYRSTREVWDSWTTLLCVVGVLAVEWILRKRFRLV